jgi:pimeloyl-ACP methyl ester carboxylesterase
MTAYLLIHGGLHDSSCWEPILAPLGELGHHVDAIDLPGRRASAAWAPTTTLDDYVACASAAVHAAPEPPIVVAHSVGGVTASALAERHPDAIRGIIYVSALIPVDGAAALPTWQEVGDDSALLKEGALIFTEDFTLLSLPPDSARVAFYGRCSEAQTKAAIERLTPEPVQPLTTPLSLGERFASVPKAYIGATHDAIVPPPFQRVLAKRCGAAFVTIDSDHSPFFSAPEALVALLSEIDQGWQRTTRTTVLSQPSGPSN